MEPNQFGSVSVLILNRFGLVLSKLVKTKPKPTDAVGNMNLTMTRRTRCCSEMFQKIEIYLSSLSPSPQSFGPQNKVKRLSLKLHACCRRPNDMRETAIIDIRFCPISWDHDGNNTSLSLLPTARCTEFVHTYTSDPHKTMRMYCKNSLTMGSQIECSQQTLTVSYLCNGVFCSTTFCLILDMNMGNKSRGKKKKLS